MWLPGPPQVRIFCELAVVPSRLLQLSARTLTTPHVPGRLLHCIASTSCLAVSSGEGPRNAQHGARRCKERTGEGDVAHWSGRQEASSTERVTQSPPLNHSVNINGGETSDDLYSYHSYTTLKN